MSEKSAAIGETMFTAIIQLCSVTHVPFVENLSFPRYKTLGLQLSLKKKNIKCRKISRSDFKIFLFIYNLSLIGGSLHYNIVSGFCCSTM